MVRPRKSTALLTGRAAEATTGNGARSATPSNAAEPQDNAMVQQGVVSGECSGDGAVTRGPPERFALLCAPAGVSWQWPDAPPARCAPSRPAAPHASRLWATKRWPRSAIDRVAVSRRRGMAAKSNS
jgi:hypothetical protein